MASKIAVSALSAMPSRIARVFGPV